MKASTLYLIALYLHCAPALGTPAAHDKVQHWLRQAANEPPHIPEVQSDPAYEYTAVKFAVTDSDLDVQAARYAELSGWEHVGKLGSLPQYRVFRQRKSTKGALGKRQQIESARQAAAGLLDVEHVEYLNQKKRLHKRGLVRELGPAGFGDRAVAKNDSVWREITDPMYAQQWHLVNSAEIGHDVNVTNVWKQGVTGSGVTVALIDDGLDYSSEDLLENFDYHGSYDFNDKTKLPTPRLVDDYHGTRCAGQIAASRNNLCGVGVAYGARVAGIRMLSKEVSDQDEVSALNYAMDTNAIYSCSWGPNDDGATVQGPSKMIEDAFINGVDNGRNGLGSVFVFATGNGGAAGDNCNFDGYTNSIYTISIGAIDHQDKHPYYSEQCSAQLAVTYSNGDGRGIVTTDLGLRACTSKHGGTSAAAPLGAGIFALALSVRPDLTWRDVQHLAVRAAIPVDLGDSDWTTVSEGRRYNHKYGFGKMDAWRIVEVAKTMEHVGKQTKIEVARDSAEVQIPALESTGGESQGVVRSVEVTKEQVAEAKLKKIEHVTVTVDMRHDFRGNVEIWLESPHGIRSQLATVRQRDNSAEGLRDWKFMSVKHWGEDAVGTWKLHVRNAYKTKLTGKLKSWQLTVFGESTEKSTTAPSNPTTSAAAPQQTADATDTPAKNKGDTKVGSGEDNSSDAEQKEGGFMRKSSAMFLSALLFVAGAVISALAVLFFMCRRERQISSARWMALDQMQGDEEAFTYGGSSNRRRFVVEQPDEEDLGVFEFADVEALGPAAARSSLGAGTAAPALHKYEDVGGDSDDGSALTDGRTPGNSSKGSGEQGDEHQRLV
ncbi:pheromone processing endoprotease [Coemansia sp. Benny D115]|nr:pheromone processing endoprotease [Coemansia sp. Benny D115]